MGLLGRIKSKSEKIIGEKQDITKVKRRIISSFNDIFQIHKSRDGREWVLVGAVKGNGNTNAEFSYYLVDENPYIGRSYYKLTQVDYNGVSETFKPITIEIQSMIDKRNQARAVSYTHLTLPTKRIV